VNNLSDKLYCGVIMKYSLNKIKTVPWNIKKEVLEECEKK
jgi:hypothetical protein